MVKRLIVVGGGASGFFAAINIAQKYPNYSVSILEKSKKLLSKVRVSGGGRCNVTHACFDPKELVSNYPRGKREMLGPFHHFSTGDVIEWFMNRGVELKVEEDGRMFPVSNSSETIIQCFLEEAQKNKVQIILDADVQTIEKSSDFRLKLKNGKELFADKVILAMGGSPKMKHYDFIQDLGHRIEKPIPSLFTFNLPKHKSNQLMGLAVNAIVKIESTNFEEYGPVLFTHWGMSGPAILKLSSKAADLLYKKSYQFKYSVEWLSNVDEFIQVNRNKYGAKKVVKSKPEELPNRLWDYLLDRASIPSHKNWADLTKSEIELLTKTLGNDLYQANGKTTFKDEFVTAGGVDLKEINMKTLESKIIPDLYFCGEIINVDALTGGFNFQAAWTTAWLVSESVGT